MRTFVCIASGPSLAAAQVDYVRGKAEVIAVNDICYLAPWADHVYACDRSWWNHHINAIRSPEKIGMSITGRLWTKSKEAAEQYALNHVLLPGNNSGFQAIHLANRLGAGRIILIGYDMQHTGGKAHWFGNHPAGFRNADGVEKWRNAFNRLNTEIPVPIINCTIDTALTCFPRRNLDDVL